MLSRNTWIDALLATAATITAVGIIWRKLIRPALRGASEFAKSAATLAEIAEQFRPNHGSSLVDRLAKIEGDVAHVTGLSQTALAQHDALGVKVQEIIDRLDEK